MGLYVILNLSDEENKSQNSYNKLLKIAPLVKFKLSGLASELCSVLADKLK